jgi:oxygen-independent coproporphyrinogen III oxidase
MPPEAAHAGATRPEGADAGSAPPDGADPRAPKALYVHVPFCVSVCPYCDFVVVAGAAARGPRSSVARYLDALTAELELRADALDAQFGGPGPGPETPRRAASSNARPGLGSVYFGGGTPSLLPASAIGSLLTLIRRRLGLEPGAEVTIEANPGAEERGSAGELREAGVTRISIGAQSMLDAELPRLGRRHRARDVVETVGAARAAGMATISLDLLYDVPGSTSDAFAASLDRALALEPDHLSVYGLSLDDPVAEGLTAAGGDHLPPSDGARRWRSRARRGQDEDRAADMYEHATARLAEAGYRGYEISNWARRGHESRHNLAYWRRQPYAAVGPGAHAFDGVTRRWNAAPLAGYLEALAPAGGNGPPRLPPGGLDRIDARTAAAEATILALRLDTGIDAGEAEAGPIGPHLGWARDAGMLTLTPAGRIALTTRGRLLSNELFARLL